MNPLGEPPTPPPQLLSDEASTPPTDGSDKVDSNRIFGMFRYNGALTQAAIDEAVAAGAIERLMPCCPTPAPVHPANPDGRSHFPPPIEGAPLQVPGPVPCNPNCPLLRTGDPGELAPAHLPKPTEPDSPLILVRGVPWDPRPPIDLGLSEDISDLYEKYR